MKLKLFLFNLLLFVTTLSNSQIDLNAIKGFVSVPPTELLINAPFTIEVENQKPVVKYFVKVEDPNNILEKFGLSTYKIESELNIFGCNKVRDFDDAEVIYTCIIDSYTNLNKQIYDTGSVLSTGGFNQKIYRGKATYGLKICSNLGVDNTCKSVFYSDIEVQTDKDTDRDKINNTMNSKSFFEKIGSVFIYRVRADFSNNTSQYMHYSSDFSTELPFSLFNQKDTKKHKKATSDLYVKEIVTFFKEMESDLYKKILIEKKLKRVKGEIRGKDLEKERISSFVLFWKQELQNKYKIKGKKKLIRTAMALNLFSAAILIKDFDNASYAYKILEDERYGYEEYNETDMKYLKLVIPGLKHIDYKY